jgi:hypothetical protein
MALATAGELLLMLGVPPLHRNPTFRRSLGGGVLVLLAAAQAVPWLAHTFTLDLPRLNTIVAFWRNLFCVWKDLYPGFLTRFLPMAFVYTPLQGIVAVHQYLGGCVLNLHLGVRTVLAQRAERRRLSSWQEVARESARDSFSALLKDSSASAAAAAGSGGSGDGKGLHVSSSVRKTARSVLAVEGRRIVEEELAAELDACTALTVSAGCRAAIGAGFFYLASFGMKLVGFAALSRGVGLMLMSLAAMLVHAKGRLDRAWRDTEEALQACAHLLGEGEPTSSSGRRHGSGVSGAALPSLLALPSSAGMEHSYRR